jgi:hypothetical protein
LAFSRSESRRGFGLFASLVLRHTQPKSAIARLPGLDFLTPESTHERHRPEQTLRYQTIREQLLAHPASSTGDSCVPARLLRRSLATRSQETSRQSRESRIVESR